MNMHAPPYDLKFWDLLRKSVFPLRPSQYDMTSVCNLTCEGCLFFSGGDNDGHANVVERSPSDAFFASEAARGIRYGYFGGAEPSLAEDKLVAAAQHIPYGVVFTNGTKRISMEVPYRLHVSIWGLPDRSRELRGADIFDKQIKNYRGDRRAVFVFTITSENLGDLAPIARMCADVDIALTFNHYSPTTKYIDVLDGRSAGDKYHSRQAACDLRLRPDDLQRSKDIIADLMGRYPRHVIYSADFNERIHNPDGLYPSIDPATNVATDCGVRLAGSLRHYNTDMVSSGAKCCSPNIECSSCRLYAQSFATFLSRGTRRIRQAHEMPKLVALWQLWCSLFLNHDQLQSWPRDAISKVHVFEPAM